MYLYVNNLEDYYGIDSPIGRIVLFVVPMRVTSYSDAEKVKCPVCSDSMIGPESFSAGHILPESRGGIMSIENIMAICPECNSQMGSRHLYWFAWHYYGKAMWQVY